MVIKYFTGLFTNTIEAEYILMDTDGYFKALEKDGNVVYIKPVDLLSIKSSKLSERAIQLLEKEHTH